MLPYRRAVHSVVLMVFVLALAQCPGFPWGDEGHRRVTTAAIGVLPKDLKAFYAKNAGLIVTLSPLPDDWKQYYKPGEGPNHYINLEELGSPPFAGLVMSLKAARAKFGTKKIEAAGLLPWTIAARYEKLVKAFKGVDTAKGSVAAKKLEDIAVQSALLAHYIADAHVPLHATIDYQGRAEARKDVHGNWEVELLDRYDVQPQPQSPDSVGKILDSAFNWCFASFKQKDKVLDADESAAQSCPSGSDGYYEILWADSGPILQGRLTSAAQAVAGVYVAAWTAGGKPKLIGKRAPVYWDK